MCHLKLMTQKEFELYLNQAIAEYADDLVKSGEVSLENSMEKSKQSFLSLLPNGVSSKQQYLFNIMSDDNLMLGMIWYGIRSEHEGFIYDFEILFEFRGQGFGKKALLLVEEHAKSIGIHKLGLRVFGHNNRAYQLYKKMGYTVYSMNMSKEF